MGPYQLVDLIGEGAMGRVYRARQESPQRAVALKLPQSGAARDAFQRFRREIALLATLEHPHIARLYDAGVAVTEQGEVPYLAMELVDGQPLTSATAGWPQRRKLELLAKLARAVHYAHTRGVVHRDLKPANVLVTADGEPKILDFGVARARDDGEATQLTGIGEILGTLPYMAWEQLSGQAGRADPRVDVYALGVIAYELLGGQRPYPELPTHSVAAALEVLRQGKPAPLQSIAPDCRGDLNTIVMKALAQDPAARYDSALALASDIERFLADLPIEARPPTTRYLLRMFVRRHRALTVATALTLVALVAAALVSTAFALREQAARRVAEEQTAAVEATNRFLEDLLSAADPEKAQGQPMTVRQIIDRARIGLEQQHTLPPSADVLASVALAMSYSQLGDNTAAMALLDGAAQRTAAQALNAMAAAKLRLVRAQVQTQLPDWAGAFETLQPLLTAEPPSEPGLARIWIDARAVAANTQFAQGHLDKAGAYMAGLGDLSARLLGADDVSTFSARANEITLLYQNGKLAEARAALDEILPRMDRSIGALHAYTLIMRQQQAIVLRDLGELDAAIATITQVAADRARVFGPTHDFTLAARRLMLQMLRMKDPASPELYRLTQETAEQLRSQYGIDNRATQQALDDYARAALAQGRAEQAEALYRELLATLARLNYGDDNETLARRQGYAELLLKTRREAQAEREFASLLPRSIAALGDEHPRSFTIRGLHGEALLALGRDAEARAELERATQLCEAKFGAEHVRTRELRAKLGQVRAVPAAS